MKWLLLGLPTGIYMMFAADTMVAPDYSSWLEGGATVVVSGLLVLIVTKIIPSAYKDHQAQLKEQRDQHIAAQERMQAAFTATLDKMAERHDRWENQRHSDSEGITEALDRLATNCQEARHGFQQGKPVV